MVRMGHRRWLAASLVLAGAFGLGACARHPVPAGAGYVTGSIKDESPRPAKVRVAKVSSVPKPSKVAAEAPILLPPLPPASAPAPAKVETARAVPAKPANPAPLSSPASAVAPGTEPPLPPTEDPAAVAELLAEGQGLFEKGQVNQARRRFIAAMNGPVPEVLLALARSYDTYYLSRLPASDGAPDMQRALVLYERALARGAATAQPDLERTRNILRIPR